jgi:hypothetical protein
MFKTALYGLSYKMLVRCPAATYLKWLFLQMIYEDVEPSVKHKMTNDDNSPIRIQPTTQDRNVGDDVFVMALRSFCSFLLRSSTSVTKAQGKQATRTWNLTTAVSR